ncbi:MAG: branched-chain amino acid ABC transporter permease [Oscillospiraceae bacterium]
MQFLIQQIISAIALGSVYALTAIGYSMVFGVLELINFSHASVFMVGAFLFYIETNIAGIPGWLAFIVAVIGTGMLGVVIEKLTLRPLRLSNQPKFVSLIATIGSSIILQNIMFLIMGSETLPYQTLFKGKNISLGGTNISYMQIITIVVSAALLIALSIFIKKSKIGMAMRATAQNYDAAELMGISVDNIVSITFFIGSAIAAVSGIFVCMNYQSVDITIGTTFGLKTFAATVLGGIGNLSGAVLGSVLIAFAEVFTAAYINTSMRDLAAFLVLVIVLLVRPNGLLGKPFQKKV